MDRYIYYYINITVWMLVFIIYTDKCFFSVNCLLNSGFALNNNNNNNYLMSFQEWKLKQHNYFPTCGSWNVFERRFLSYWQGLVTP